MPKQQTEIDIGGIKFKGGRVFFIITILTSFVGVLWGGFEAYQRYLDMEAKINSFVSPDLSGFDNVTFVYSSVRINDNDSLQTLDGLNNLTAAASFFISGNPQLNSLSALSNVNEISQRLYVENNDSLVSLDGVQNITFATDLSIKDNLLLQDIDALNNLTEVAYLFHFEDNPALCRQRILELKALIESRDGLNRSDYISISGNKQC